MAQPIRERTTAMDPCWMPSRRMRRGTTRTTISFSLTCKHSEVPEPYPGFPQPLPPRPAPESVRRHILQILPSSRTRVVERCRPRPELPAEDRFYFRVHQSQQDLLDPEGILLRPMEPPGHNHELPTVSPTPGGEKELLGRTWSLQ